MQTKNTTYSHLPNSNSTQNHRSITKGATQTSFDLSLSNVEYLRYGNSKQKDISIIKGATPPFGMLARSVNNNAYRFGFQGQEGDNEIYGEGNLWTYKYRMEDSRLGRFFTPDPLA
ncbi:MAG: hypothetical protein L3J56_14055, partial [Bacteroidales bacterium]|nr:hypothetical protein [Bacteroidales bacterium]